MADKFLVVGNGTTRQTYNIQKAKDLGFGIFACNAAYREFPEAIDLLVALDEKIINEINASTFPKNKFYVPPFDGQFEPAVYNPNRPRNNAAMIAMERAIAYGAEKITIIGCDFVLENKDLNCSNVFDGTNAYGPETRTSFFDTIARCRFMDWFANQNQHVVFNFLFPEHYKFRDMHAPNVFYTVDDQIS